jgi:hypothetical protein
MEVAMMLASGAISATALVWRVGAPGWIPAAAIVALPATAATSGHPRAPDHLPPEFLRPGRIIADIGIIFGLTFLGGFVVGFVSAFSYGVSAPMLALGASNLVLGTIGFILSGMRAPAGNRWPHLLWVALGVWILGLINVLFGLNIGAWIASAAGVAMTMGIGGAISMAIKR